MADEDITITDSPYNFDGIWKEFIRNFWPIILRDFIPDLYEAADIERGAEFLDKEMHEISQEADGESEAVSKWYVDNLLKIYLKDGREEWVLLHIEVQGKGGEIISLRMFRYSCMIFLKYGKHPAAMAILTAKRPKKEGDPSIYRADVFGTKTEYSYHTVKAYEYDDDELLASDSPVKLFIYAVKVAAKYRRSDRKKLEYMLKVMRVLKSKDWSDRDCRMFMRFLEFLMMNSRKEYRMQFIENEIEFLEGKKVRLMTFEEQITERATAKGLADGIAKGRAEANAATARYLMGLGIMTDEQIAQAVQQTPEYIASLRAEATTLH